MTINNENSDNNSISSDKIKKPNKKRTIHLSNNRFTKKTITPNKELKSQTNTENSSKKGKTQKKKSNK